MESVARGGNITPMKDMVTLIATLGIIAAMWWQLDSKFAREIHALDTRLTSRMDALDSRMDTLDGKIDQLNTLLTNNLITLNRDVGELKGQVHRH